MKYLSMDELKLMLRAIPEEKSWQRLMFLVAFWHGLRVSELVGRQRGGQGPYGLKGKDIQHGYVDVRRLKGSDHTVQPFVFHPDSELDEGTELMKLAARIGPEEPVFPISVRGVQYIMSEIMTRSGLNRKKMHPHVLKHTHAMQAIKAGIGIETVRSTLGHKSLASTGFYTRIPQDDAMKSVAHAIGGGKA